MQDRFDRGLFATLLLALALLISVSSAARFPSALRLTNPFAGVRVAEASAAPAGGATALR